MRYGDQGETSVSHRRHGLHAVWTLPVGDADYPTRWMVIKAGFSRNLPKGERRNASRVTKGERGIWQRRYWEQRIRHDGDYERHVDYMHFNPVERGLIYRPLDGPYSTFRGYMKAGMHTNDWASNEVLDEEVCGE